MRAVRRCERRTAEPSPDLEVMTMAKGTRRVRRYKAGTIGLAERLWLYMERDPSGCWEWQGLVGNHGYGVVGHDGATRLAHRVAYELLVGPIPASLTVDHICFNKVCLNPSHMEIVTRAENARRGEKLRRTRQSGTAARMACRTECKNGHPYVDGSYRMDGNARICRHCARSRLRAFRAKAGK